MVIPNSAAHQPAKGLAGIAAGDVDHAVDRIGAVERAARPADHLDLLRYPRAAANGAPRTRRNGASNRCFGRRSAPAACSTSRRC